MACPWRQVARYAPSQLCTNRNLQCLSAGLVAETATFIAEAAEDENDRVVQEAHRLKAAVEAVGGSIDVS